VKSFGIVVIVLVLVGVPLGVFLVAREPAAAPAMADPDKTIDLRGAIGGIRPLETRTDAEALLGQGVVVSSTRHALVGGRTAILTRVRYPASQITIVYAQARSRAAYAFLIETTSARYHTSNGLRVGSTLAKARTPGVKCTHQQEYDACQAALGYEKPVTGFTVKNGRVVNAFVAATAD
jgi:hypothetical protein